MIRKANHKKRVPGPANTNGWQIIYTGFILILLSFFIMLTSFASLDEAKITRFTRAFSSAVNVFDSGKSLEEGETLLKEGAMMIDKEDRLARLFHEVKMLSEQLGLHDMDIRRNKDGVDITLADKLLFTSGQAKLSNPAKSLLEKIARIIERIRVPVEIQGHSDDRPIHSEIYASNWELSTARAVSVLRYLIETQKVEANRLSAVGFSKYQPAVENNSDKNRAKNRRVTIVFKPL